MKLKDLLKAVDGTALQRDDRAKRLVGSDIHIHADVTNIDDQFIDVWWFNFRYGTVDYDERIETDNLSIKIRYNKSTFGDRLLAYSRGDRVSMLATLTQATFSSYFASYEFELISIRKLSTGEEREKAEQDAAAAKNVSTGCFVATACYGNYDAPEVVMLRQYRDRRLLGTRTGRMAVTCYYALSPFLVALMSKSDLVKTLIKRGVVEHAVVYLRQRGPLD